jgi:hypothetical protein
LTPQPQSEKAPLVATELDRQWGILAYLMQVQAGEMPPNDEVLALAEELGVPVAKAVETMIRSASEEFERLEAEEPDAA